jgi:hypothetical protein
MKTAKLNMKPVMALLVGASLMIAISATSSAATAADDDDKRVSLSRHFQGDGRDGAVAIKETRDEYDKLSLTGVRANKTRSSVQSKTSSEQPAMSPNTDFWFYLADVELYADDDRDGYYSGVDLLFDVDTYHTVADIYAVAYLSYEGGPWEEYAATEDFTIFGSSGTDDYVIVSDLVIFDADNNEFLAFFGPEDSSELAFLPLEDIDRDSPAGGTRVTVNHGGGGSFDLVLLAILGLIATAARRRLTDR